MASVPKPCYFCATETECTGSGGIPMCTTCIRRFNPNNGITTLGEILDRTLNRVVAPDPAIDTSSLTHPWGPPSYMPGEPLLTPGYIYVKAFWDGPGGLGIYNFRVDIDDFTPPSDDEQGYVEVAETDVGIYTRQRISWEEFIAHLAAYHDCSREDAEDIVRNEALAACLIEWRRWKDAQ